MLYRCLRDWKKTALFTLLIALAIMIISAGAIVLNLSRTAVQQADEQIITIAVRHSLYKLTPDPTKTDIRYTEEIIVDESALTETIGTCDAVLAHQMGAACTAVLDEAEPLYSADLLDASYRGAEKIGWRQAALIVTCLSVEDGVGDAPWSATARVEEVLAYPAPERVEPELRIRCGKRYLTDEGEMPIKAGEKYIVYGDYMPPGYIQVPGYTGYIRDDDSSFGKLLRMDGFYENNEYARGVKSGVVYTMEEIIALSEKVGYTLHPEYPYLTAAPNDEYAQKLVEMIRWNNRRLLVYATDYAEQMLYFHEKEANIISGRWFTPDEIASAAPVCLLSTALANKNGLTVGDKVSGELFPVTWEKRVSGTPTLVLMSRLPEQATASAEWTIIGLYSAPAWESSNYAIDLNTVFVPRGVLGASGETVPVNLQTVILKNGRAEEFLDDLAAGGFPDDLYSVHDGGYAELQPTLRTMGRDAVRIMLICVLVGFGMVVVSLLLYCRTWRNENHILYLLGAPTKHIRRRLFAGLSLMLAASAVVSAALVMLFKGELTERIGMMYLDESNLQLADSLDIGSAAIIMLAVCLAVWAVCYAVSAYSAGREKA